MKQTKTSNNWSIGEGVTAFWHPMDQCLPNGWNSSLSFVSAGGLVLCKLVFTKRLRAWQSGNWLHTACVAGEWEWPSGLDQFLLVRLKILGETENQQWSKFPLNPFCHSSISEWQSEVLCWHVTVCLCQLAARVRTRPVSALPGQQQRLRVSKYQQGATMEMIDEFAALKFLITLKRKQEIINSIIISLARGQPWPEQKGERA